jgi:uncharacterized peroxidase-related enzyme
MCLTTVVSEGLGENTMSEGILYRRHQMAFIDMIPEGQAEGKLLELYKSDRDTKGYVANHTAAFSLRPEVYEAWKHLLMSIRSNMRLRWFELVTFAVASDLGCTYCKLAHGTVLLKNFFTAEEMKAIAKDFRHAGLAPKEVAIMEFAQKLTREACNMSVDDVEKLRSHGLSDVEILDVVLAAASRNFMSKTLDSLGVEPDQIYTELDADIREALTEN